MIPAGILASSVVPPAAGGGGGVVQSKAATGTTVTLDAAPTPGNTLVLAVTNAVTDPATWTFSHSLAVDVAADQSGWDAVIISGEVQGGDSATITITGMNTTSSYGPAISVHEIEGSVTLVDSATDGLASGASLSGSVSSGVFVAAAVIIGGNHSSLVFTGVTEDLTHSRGGMGSAESPGLPLTVSADWSTNRSCALAIGAYA